MAEENYYVLILKCKEDNTFPSNNTYEKISLYHIINNGAADNYSNLQDLIEKEKENNPNKLKENPIYSEINNHAIIFIHLTGSEIITSEPCIQYKYFSYEDISNKFLKSAIITDINNATIMECKKSNYEIKKIKTIPNADEIKYETIKFVTNDDDVTNILINNGGQIIFTSSQNTDENIRHLVSKMFGFQDVISDLEKQPTNNGGGGIIEDLKTSNHGSLKITQQGGKKKKSKKSTRKKNQK